MAKTIALRFGVVFGVLMILPFPLDVLPKTDWLVEAYGAGWDHITRAFGELIGITVPPMQPTGSGDTMASYVQLLIVVLVAVLVTAVWSVVHRDRTEYPRMAAGARVALRYWLGVVMMSYGFAKLFKTQFPFPLPAHLEERVGDMSPMGLLWTFMGYSTPYNIFAGAAETLGGVLLFWRRTTLIGALVIAAAMSNVVMLNFCYDVPVKLYSSLLLVAAIVLALPDARRLVACLLGRATPEALPARMPLSVRWNRARIAGKALAIGYVLFRMTSEGLSYREQLAADPGPLYGIYDVEQIDGAPWQTLIVSTTTWATVRTTTHESRGFQLALTGDQLALTGKDSKGTLVYQLRDGRLVLDGTLGADKIHAALKRRDPGDFLLVQRGFNWVQELPFNR